MPRLPRPPLAALPILILLATPRPGASAQPPMDRDVSRSVVKVHVTQRGPDLVRPWLKGAPAEGSGTGVVLEGKRILTSAHAVRYASVILVQPPNSPDKFPATVEALAADMDLALLKVDDPTFFDRHPPLPRSGRLPRVKDAVLVYGYPVGGDALSITKGIVSRIEFESFYFEARGLRVQVDAAINSGNSGGAAVVDDAMIGVIFSKLQEADNIGYIIPNEEIDLFLKDVADGRYDGKPALYDILQLAQNDALRARLKLAKGVNGLLVWIPARDDPSYPLKRWDVITRIGDHPLDGAGMVDAGLDQKLYFAYYVPKLARDGTVPLEVVREGKTVKLDVPVSPSVTRPLRLPYLYYDYPSYLVWGPFTFSPATSDLINTLAQDQMAQHWYPFWLYNQSPLLRYHGDPPSFEGEQLVVVVSMFPHRLVQGYSPPLTCVVDRVNDVAVKNLRHLASLLRDVKDERVTITFRDRMADVIVLDRKQVLATADDIFSDNGVRKPYSDDLKSVMETRP